MEPIKDNNLDSMIVTRTEEDKSGGRGTVELRNRVHFLLNKYSNLRGSLSPPINVKVLAQLQNAKIIYRRGPENSVASMMPMGGCFIITVNDSLSQSRKRNAICHEIAHTFFFVNEGRLLRRAKNSCSNKCEELLCFWAARELLVPSDLLSKEMNKLGQDAIYMFSGLLKLSRTFLVSPDIIAYRLTHDLALLGDDWIVLWYGGSQTNRRLQARSLYPRHISDSISGYFKGRILDFIATTVKEAKEKGNFIEKYSKVGNRKPFRFKVRTEWVHKEKLCAVSWVSRLNS